MGIEEEEKKESFEKQRRQAEVAASGAESGSVVAETILYLTLLAP